MLDAHCWRTNMFVVALSTVSVPRKHLGSRLKHVLCHPLGASFTNARLDKQLALFLNGRGRVSHSTMMQT